MLPFPALVPMDAAQDLALQVRAEERYRSGSDIDAEETELSPQLRYDLGWSGGQDRFVMFYQPRLVYTVAGQPKPVDQTEVDPQTLHPIDFKAHPLSVLHQGGFGVELTRPRWRLSAYQFGAYGPVTTTMLLMQPVWDPQELPEDPYPIIPATIAGRFTLLFLQTQIFVPIRLSRRVALIPGATYNAFGGADSASRATMPLTQGPGGSLALEVDASRNDRFTSLVGAGQVTVTFEDETRAGPVITRAEAKQSWRHWYTKNVATDVMGGASLGGSKLFGYSIYTVAHAGILYDSYGQTRIAPGAPPEGPPEGRGDRLQLGVVARVGPWIDFFSGDFEQRGMLDFAANYIVGRTTFRTQIWAGRVFNTPASVSTYQLVFTDTGIRYQITPVISIDGGIRYGNQSYSNALRFADVNQTTLYAGLTVTPLPARF